MSGVPMDMIRDLSIIMSRFPAVYADLRVSAEMMENMDPVQLSDHVTGQLGASLGKFVVEHKLADGADKSGFAMEHSYADLCTHYRVQAHVLTPNELRDALKAAWDAGRESERDRDCGDYYTPVLP